MGANPLDGLKWDEDRRRWFGHVELAPGEVIEVAVRVGRRDPAVPLALAKFAYPLLHPRIDEASRAAAQQLQPYFNVFNAHLRDGEQVTEEEFADRLELEAIWFTGKGSSTL